MKKIKCKSCGERGVPKNNSTIGYYCEKEKCQGERIAKALEKVRKQQMKEEKKADKEWNEERKLIMKKLKTHKDYMKDLQTVFNAYIRERDKNLPCISCGTFNAEEFHAGHYIPTTFQYLRFNEFNVWKQCSKCNTHLRGNIVAYRIELINRIGLKAVEKLEDDRHITRKLSIPELIELKVKYKDKLKQLK